VGVVAGLTFLLVALSDLCVCSAWARAQGAAAFAPLPLGFHWPLPLACSGHMCDQLLDPLRVLKTE